jgi:hypothetical protein
LDSRPTRQPTRLAFHASRIVIDIGVLMVLGSMSLAFVTTDMGNKTALDADALPTLLLLLPIFIITLLPDHSAPIPDLLGWSALILGFGAFPYALIKYLDASTLASSLGGAVGWGARLHVFGTFVVIAGIGIGLARNFLRLPVAGTYPSRPEPRWIRHRPQRPSGKTAATTTRPTTVAPAATEAPVTQRGRSPGQPAARPGAAVPPARRDPDATTQVIPAVPPRRSPAPEPESDDEATTEVVTLPEFPVVPGPSPSSTGADPDRGEQEPLIPDFLDASADDPDQHGPEPGRDAGPGG